MQIVIDIPKEILKTRYYTDYFGCGSHKLTETLDNAIPIPDNATNGDVIKAMFDIAEEYFYDEDRMVDVYGLDRTDDPSTFYADWWNAPYQKGGKDADSN